MYLDVDVRALSSRDRDRPIALLMVRDVTDRVEEHERAALFYESFRSSTNVMQLTDADGVMVDVNPAYERVYGYSREECIGSKPSLVRSQHTPVHVYEGMWRDLVDPSRGYWSGETLNRDRKGRERPVLLSITAIRNTAGKVTHYLGVAVDLSEQRSWELRAAHADKLASVGQLAAGVAHEINTPLANVMLAAESLRRKTHDPWVLARLERMSEQIEIAARIVRGLLDFAHREEPHIVALDMVELTKAFDRVPPRETIRGRGDRGGLPDRRSDGPRRPRTADASADERPEQCVRRRWVVTGRSRSRSVTRATGPVVEIIDQGPGIAAEALPHIFEPFYTTKPEGEGTGLGLAICHGIVQSHHGTITARNVPGAGAGFQISLPLQGRLIPP